MLQAEELSLDTAPRGTGQRTKGTGGEPPTDGTYTRRVSWAIRLEEGTHFYASCKEAETVA